MYYSSEIAPAAKGYDEKDLLKEVIANAHANNIRVFAWVPQFHDQILAERRPDLRMQTVRNGKSLIYTNARNEFFVNPLHPDVQNYELSILREIATNYEVDGIVLDWLRFDNYAMDLSEYTRELYKKDRGYDPAIIDFKTDNPQRTAWNEWRERKLADYLFKVAQTVKQARPSAQIGAFVLPPEFKECGQNISFFKESLDFISPMLYYEDWGYKPKWVWENVLADTSHKVSCQIIPTLGMDWKDDVYVQLFKQIRRDYPQINRVSLFLYGQWTDTQLSRASHIVDSSKISWLYFFR